MKALSRFKRARRVAFWFAAALIVPCGPALAAPFTAYIDTFGIERNGTQFFVDNFSDGIPPPSALPDSRTYFVNGSFAGGESGGKLRIGGDGYALSQNALGQPRLVNSATLLTNNDSANTTDGLKRNFSFDVYGLFDYVVPSSGDSYGVRLTDGGQNDVVDLRVSWSTLLGAAVVSFYKQDFVLGTLTLLQEVALPAAYNGPIALDLSHDANSDVINAIYCLGDLAFCSSEANLQILSASTTIFNGELWTRADFRAVTSMPVPEPGSLALLAIGLAGLGYSRRAKR